MEIWVEYGVTVGPECNEKIQLFDSRRDGKMTPGAYALWPANVPTVAPRRLDGTVFTLHVCCPAGSAAETQVRAALKAWLLFGGYGGRTRRGLGSFTLDSVTDPKSEQWLPANATLQSVAKVFGFDPFTPTRGPSQSASLSGATLCCGLPTGKNAEAAWTFALDHWLKEFRQGTNSGARNLGTATRPGQSNWPEADKVRWHHSDPATGQPHRGYPWAHDPNGRHNKVPAYPRAGFGLPIGGQFQRIDSSGNFYDHRDKPFADRRTEPSDFTLVWHDGQNERDRLASPLIIKALPLEDGTFVPIALWLNRADPQGHVRIRGEPKSRAGFSPLIALGDKSLFQPLIKDDTVIPGILHTSLRDSFMGWICTQGATKIA